MCELLAMSANVPTDICFSFAGLLKRGGDTGEHKDGWGIVFYEDGGVKVFKDTVAASESQIAKMLVSYPIKSLQVIGHIRKANVGEITLRNTHPFVRHLFGVNFTFAHNGQMPEIKNKKLEFYEPVGETDSEHVFCYFLSKLAHQFTKKQTLNNEFWDLIFDLCQQTSKLGVFNMIIGNGNQLAAYCHDKLCHITRRAPFGPASLLDDDFYINFSEHTTENDIVSVIATTPLTKDEDWVIMKPRSMAIFDQGSLVREFLVVQGKFITIEGIEGVGKSTLIQKIQTQLSKDNLSLIITKEPGGTSLGLKIRKILFDLDEKIDPMTELLLLFADRNQHYQQIIKPALSQGKIVISDRFVDSTYAYQGAGRGIQLDRIKQLEQICYGSFKPDLVLWLDLDVHLAFERVLKRKEPSNRFEKEKLDFFIDAKKMFEQRAKKYSYIVRLDASLDETTLSKLAIEKIDSILK